MMIDIRHVPLVARIDGEHTFFRQNLCAFESDVDAVASGRDFVCLDVFQVGGDEMESIQFAGCQPFCRLADFSRCIGFFRKTAESVARPAPALLVFASVADLCGGIGRYRSFCVPVLQPGLKITVLQERKPIRESVFF